ncbi:NBS-LRR resistance protein, putative [Medicago truncatula]|uniref:NBS-LRR resistance protein, putative n=1 Tax=Medicago truncatula TaxID=3880 RepID=G7JYN4_MEDTR|nr:NBS-LRR resistance protein, putative [Medicago truncatula]
MFSTKIRVNVSALLHSNSPSSFSNSPSGKAMMYLPSPQLLDLSKYSKSFNLTQFSNLISLKLCVCNKVVRLPSLGKLTSLKKLELFRTDNLKYLDDDEFEDGMEVRVFPSLENCPKLGLPCHPSLKHLVVEGCNNELLRSISTFRGLQYLVVLDFRELKELPNEPFKPTLTHLYIYDCNETLTIWDCKGLRCLPEGIRHLTSLEVLRIIGCPTLEERCKEGTRVLSQTQ